MNKQFILVGILLILCLNMTSALFPTLKETPTLKSGVEISDTANEYPAIEITDWLGLGGTKADLVLTEHTQTCSNDCMSQFQITTYSDSPLVDDVKFWKINDDGSQTLSNIRSYQFYIQTDSKEIEVPDYEYQCTNDGFSSNGTAIQTCKNVQTGSHTEITPEWMPYTIGTEMPSGTYVVKLVGDKRSEWSYDWKIDTQGKTLNEWSVWGSSDDSLLNGTWLYYTLNATTGTAVSTSVGSRTGTISGAGAGSTSWQPAKISNGFTQPKADAYIQTDANIGITGNSPFSINLWVNSSDNLGTEPIFAMGSSGTQDNIVALFKNNLTQLSINYWGNNPNINLPSSLSSFTMLTYVNTGTELKLYSNGVKIYNETRNLNIQANKLYFGGSILGSYAGTFDEIGMWNRGLTETEISNLYNSGAGRTYGQFNISYTSITLNSPANGYISPTNLVTFNATIVVTGGSTAVNTSLLVDGVINQTATTLNPVSVNSPSSLPNTAGPNGQKGGMKIYAKNNITIQSFAIGPNTGGDSCYVLDSAKNVIYTGTLNNRVCSFTTGNISSGAYYYLAVAQVGGTGTYNFDYDAGGNYAGVSTYFNWTNGLDPNGASDVNRAYIVKNVTIIPKIEGISSMNVIFNLNITTSKNWSIQACDSDGVCGLSENRTVNIDTQAPSINILYPTGTIPIASVGQNISLNYSITDTNLGSCWYNYNGTTNVSISCTSNSSFILGTQKSITLYANDSVGNLNTSSFSWDYNVFENSRSYNSSALETTRQSYVLNTTINTTQWIAQSATFYYNNSAIATTKTSSGNNILFTSSTDLPGVTADTSKDMYWALQLTNSSGNYMINTSVSNQTITKTQFQRCAGAVNVTFVNFSVYDQANTNNKVNTTFLATFNYWAGDGSIKSSYTYQETGTPTNSSFPFCLNPGSGSISIDADIQYGNVNGFAQNYFYYRSKSITNTTTEQPLYLLNASSSTITTLRVIDSYQNGLVGYIGKIYKHDVGTNTDVLVGMFKTNYAGQDIAYLNWYDTLYKFVVYDSSETNIVYSADPFKVASTPQSFRISTVASDITWLKFQDILYTFTQNNDTRTFLLTFNDPNNHITAGCLRIIKSYKGNASIISDNCVNSTSGTIVYTIPDGQYGDFYGVFYGKGSIGLVQMLMMALPDYTQEIYKLLGNQDATILAIIVISLFAIVGAVISPVAFIVMTLVGYLITGFLGFQMAEEFQIAFYLFLAVGGYLAWKMRT